MPVVNVLGSFADPLNQDQGAAKLVNCRIVVRKPDEQKPALVRLVGSPGLTQVCKPTNSPCISLCTALNAIWSAHADGSIYRSIETGLPVFVGTVAVVGGEPPIIRLAEDRTALCIASAGFGYTATFGGLFPTNFDFFPSAVCNLDSYTVWANLSPGTDKMYSSIPLDPANVPANSFATAEARADVVLDVVTIGRTFWPFGNQTVEMWYDQGGSSDFAFVPFTNSLLEVGLAARRTLASLHSKVLWVATDRRIWMGQGQSGSPVSPSWIDLLLQQTDLSQLTAYMYAQGGDEFYVLTLENQWTIELALSTMTWCYRKSAGRNDHAGRCALEYDGGNTYVGLVTGEVCRVDLTTADEPAGRLTRQITTMWLGDQETRNVINQIDATSYMGPEAGTFELDWSEDRLQTFKGLRTITWPQPGIRRAIARGLGTSRRRQVRLTYSGSKAPFELDEFFVQVSPGT